MLAKNPHPGGWEIVTCHPTIRPISCKRVYTVKFKSDGTLNRYKAQLAALGKRLQEDICSSCENDHGLDQACHFWLSILVNIQMDVKNVFLHGNLNELIYMHPPKGILVKSTNVSRFQKSLYGLKQAHRAQFTKSLSTILSLF